MERLSEVTEQQEARSMDQHQHPDPAASILGGMSLARPQKKEKKKKKKDSAGVSGPCCCMTGEEEDVKYVERGGKPEDGKHNLVTV